MPRQKAWLKYFSGIDARYYILTNHVILIFIGFAFFKFQRTPFQMISGLVTALLTEFIFGLISDKNRGRGLYDRFLSAVIASLSLFILVNSPHPLFYAYGGVIAIASKYIFRLDEKRHAFNPTNVAIIVLLVIMAPSNFRFYGDEFNVSALPIFPVFFFGFLATLVSDRWRISLAYSCVIILGGIFSHVIGGQGFLFYGGPEFSPTGLTFILFMITDPRTSPTGHRQQFFAGSAIAVLSLIFKYNEVLYGQFIGTFIVAGFRCLIIALSPRPKAVSRVPAN